MGELGTLLVIAGLGAAILVGVVKTFRQLKSLADRPARPRQPWEYGGPS